MNLGKQGMRLRASIKAALFSRSLRFVLSNKEGMHFGVHGPVDQGAYNEYYQPKENSRELHQRFNAKVYNTFQREGA
eukprot:scaffold120518_cov20-Tisochrysis_lutea.AAC.1